MPSVQGAAGLCSHAGLLINLRPFLLVMGCEFIAFVEDCIGAISNDTFPLLGQP